MRIKTENFKKYASVLQEFYSRGIGCETTEGIYFNFDDSYAYLETQGDKIYGKMKFEYIPDENDDIKNFYISIPKFISLCTQEWVEIDNGYVFYVGTGTFKLRYLIEDDLSMVNSIELFDKELNVDNTLVFDKEKLDKLKTTSKYLYKKGLDFAYRAVYIHPDNYMFSLLTDQIYETDIKYDNDETIIIYNDFVNMINRLGEDTKLYIGENFDKIISKDSDLEIIMPKQLLAIPPIRTEEFISVYDVESRIEFNHDDLALGLAVLSPYFKNFGLKRIFIDVENEDVTFRFEEEGEKVEQVVDTDNIVDILSCTMELNGENLKKAIETLGGEKIFLYYNIDNPSYICLKSDLSEHNKVILSLIVRN